MGYLTTITIHNDALHSFEKNPQKFGQAILDGIHQANDNRVETAIGFEGYCNYINIQPSRHADDETVYVHTGNTVFNLNPYNKDFQILAARNKDIAKSFIQRAQRLVTAAKKALQKL